MNIQLSRVPFLPPIVSILRLPLQNRWKNKKQGINVNTYLKPVIALYGVLANGQRLHELTGENNVANAGAYRK